MMAQSICQACGSALEPDWQFCEHCGSPVAPPAWEQATMVSAPRSAAVLPARPAQIPQPVQPQPARLQPPPGPGLAPARRFPWWLLLGGGCLVMVCVCLLAVVAYFAFVEDAPDPLAVINPATPTTLPTAALQAPEAPTPTPETALPTAQEAPPAEPPSPTPVPLPTEAPPPTAVGQALTGNQYRDAVSIFDDFSSKALDWPEYDDGSTILRYENEAYSFQIAEPDYYDWVYAPVDFWPNSIQFDVWGLPGLQNGTMGVMCQFQDAENYYYVEIDLGTRDFILGKAQAGEYIPLTIPDETGLNWLRAEPLKSSPDQVNRIDLSCYQDFMVLVINDSLVYHVDVPEPFSTPGEMAFFVYAYASIGPEGYKVFFDNVSVQQLEE